MDLVFDIAGIVIGTALIAGSRTIADGFRIRRPQRPPLDALINFAGLGDSYVSRLYRWIVSVVVGAAFLVVGLVQILSK